MNSSTVILIPSKQTRARINSVNFSTIFRPQLLKTYFAYYAAAVHICTVCIPRCVHCSLTQGIYSPPLHKKHMLIRHTTATLFICCAAPPPQTKNKGSHSSNKYVTIQYISVSKLTQACLYLPNTYKLSASLHSTNTRP